MYRDDDAARANRATSLIDEIAALERQKVAHAATEQRLTDARRELAALQVTPASAPVPRSGASLQTHLLVFAISAASTFAAYVLLA